MRKCVQKADVQVVTDTTPQIFEWRGLGNMPLKRLLDSAAYVGGAIQQGSIDIEQVNRKRDQPAA